MPPLIDLKIENYAYLDTSSSQYLFPCRDQAITYKFQLGIWPLRSCLPTETYSTTESQRSQSAFRTSCT